MTVKASGQITLSAVVDVSACWRFYKLQSSTLAVPSRPTTKPPPSGWTTTEPSYQAGSTNTLYFCDRTDFCDGTYSYSEVSCSSSYEAAKAAYNKAVAAGNAAADVEARTSVLETDLKVVQGNIASKVWQSDINQAKDELGGEITELSDQYSTMHQTVDGITTKVGTLETTMQGKAEGKDVTALSSRVSSVEQTAGGLTTRVEDVESGVQQNASSIQQLADGISLTVTGGAGGTAEISLTVNGETKKGQIVLTGDVLADAINVERLMAKDLVATGHFEIVNDTWGLIRTASGVMLGSGFQEGDTQTARAAFSPSTVDVSALGRNGTIRLSANYVDVQGALTVNGNGVAPAGHAHTAGQVGAAPAGYGLGGNAIEINYSDIDTTVKNGWYRFFTTELSGLGYNTNTWLLCVHSYIDSRVCQTLIPVGFTARLERSSFDSVWTPWEYTAPPMKVGVGYRTTERYEGKPVYTILIDCGAAANNKQVGLNDAIHPIRSAGKIGSSLLPYSAESDTWWARLIVEKGFMRLKCSENWATTANNAWVTQLWYTKE